MAAYRVKQGACGAVPAERQPACVGSRGPLDDEQLLGRLRALDEAAFEQLVETYNGALLRVARGYVRTRELAEEVVQETWLGVIRGVDRFEGRSSLKTWVFRILVNSAKSRGVAERRYVPSSAAADATAADGAAVDPGRFFPPEHALCADHWATGPRALETPHEGLLSREVRKLILEAIDSLPPAQGEVILLRDIHGWRSDEVCELMGITPANQRVLLHRARAKVRTAMADYFGATAATV